MLFTGSDFSEAPLPDTLTNATKMHFDFVQAADDKAVRSRMNRVSADRIVYGSAAPLKSFTANTSLLQRAQLSPGRVQAIRSGNAQRLMR
jgi:predicted TIM-barrel fold metal-dependent hydrolase